MSDEKQAVERIWVGITQGAEMTGVRKEYLRHLAESIWGQPTEERPLKVRFRSNRYEFWLPDLIPYIKNSDDASEFPKVDPNVEPIWVSTGEGAEMTGYNTGHLLLIARRMWQQPEGERLIRVRNRARRYELWLPDLMAYIENFGHGPHAKPQKKSI